MVQHRLDQNEPTLGTADTAAFRQKLLPRKKVGFPAAALSIAPLNARIGWSNWLSCALP